MKRIFLKLAVLMSAASVLGAGRAAGVDIYSTNFDEFDSGLPLSHSQQPGGFRTNDPYNAATNTGQSAFVGQVSNYSKTTTDYWALLGGFSPDAPGSFSITVSKPFSTSGILTGATGADTVRFTVDASFASSAIPRPNRDAFGWDFRTAADAPLFRIAFVPDSVVPNTLNLQYVSGNNVATPTTTLLQYDSIYRFTIDVGLADAVRDSLTVRITDSTAAPTTTTPLNNFTLAEGTASSLGAIGARWDILNPAASTAGKPTAYGSNSLIFENFKVAVVPEPGSTLLLVSGLAVAGLRRRR